MKFVTFEVETVLGRFQRLGVLEESRILDLNTAYALLLQMEGEAQPKRLADVRVPSCMLSFLQMGSSSLKEARRTVDYAEGLSLSTLGIGGAVLWFEPGQVKLLSPLPQAAALRDFQAFEAHTKKGYELRNETVPEEWYQLPIYYKGNPKTLIGPEAPVFWPAYTEKLDYELELACIIGKEGRNIPVEAADEYIFGYAVLNDFSARDIQRKEMRCRLGPAKGKDFATALGPYILTADAVKDPRNLTMVARVNGEQWSKGNSGDCYWTFAQMIAHVSQDEMLYPGDIFGSGTVGGGCGMELDRWIQPGDVVELEIDQLGILRNPVVRNAVPDADQSAAASKTLTAGG